MALSFAFRERLDEMEIARNQRLVLLQAEKELQASKSQILASKLANIRSMEHRCLMLDHKIATQNLKISILKSEIEDSDAKYQIIARQLRNLKSEIEELEVMGKEKEKFYEAKRVEMSEFRRNIEEFKSEIHAQVQNLRNRSDEVKAIGLEIEVSGQHSGHFEDEGVNSDPEQSRQTKQTLIKGIISVVPYVLVLGQ
ncbi:PREDICTED: uncharacterized protein LOC104814695 [Tarenaya hassleriana]|uniref:uncharacterized protein LOC104814695 n=1 Tax=Tarenaya hassleriana TaxID=28532 RepID=UPI00053C0899|nr:PREDICTED: uncharacterized protein LOC104814695 [Tarenaya hassleriana]